MKIYTKAATDSSPDGIHKYLPFFMVELVLLLAVAGLLAVHVQQDTTFSKEVALSLRNSLAMLSPTPPTQQVLGVQAPPPETVVILPFKGPPTPVPKKKSYTIAVIGDSEVQTMGAGMEYLQASLKKRYPDTEFVLDNYGIGAQNVEDGLARFDKPLKDDVRDYPSIPDLKPDIIIVASFAYNPFNPFNRDEHWVGLTKLVQSAQKVSNKVYMLAEIAPIKKGFGKGPNGVNWGEQASEIQAQHIDEQLQNAVGLSKALNVPIIDAFTPTYKDGEEIAPVSINPSDGIHPSMQGHTYMADKIAETLQLD